MFERCAIRQCVNLSIVDDTVPEETEYFTVKIGRSLNLHPNINLRPTEANITISDDGKQRLGTSYVITTTFYVPIMCMNYYVSIFYNP